MPPYFFSPCKLSKAILADTCASEATLTMRAGALAASLSQQQLRQQEFGEMIERPGALDAVDGQVRDE